MIDFASSGKSFQAYLCTPHHPAPGVIVIQEWWGLVDHIKEVCDRFAAEGFSSLAPDLYNGTQTKSPDEAGKLLMALNIQEAEKILRGAVDTLLSNALCSSKTVGVVGFCMGGQLALQAAATHPKKISACVDYYGVHPNAHPPFEAVTAPILGFFAEHDTYANPEVVKTLDERLNRLRKQHEFHTFKGTHHAFFNDTKPETYDANASLETWSRMLEFLRAYVK